MLRFFRQIRQRLLTDNKFSKYLLYAIGEILLVVIGILIALQIDNWNEKRKEEERLTDFLREIQNDLSDDILKANDLIDGYIAKDSILRNIRRDKVTYSPEKYLENRRSLMLIYEFDNFRLQSKGYEGLVQNIDNIPESHSKLKGLLNFIYVTNKYDIESSNERVKDIVYKNMDNIKGKEWSGDFWNRNLNDDMITYFQGNSYKNEAIYYSNDYRNFITHIIKFKIKAIESYEEIARLMADKSPIPRHVSYTYPNPDILSHFKGEFQIVSKETSDSDPSPQMEFVIENNLINWHYVYRDINFNQDFNVPLYWHKDNLFFNFLGPAIFEFNFDDKSNTIFTGRIGGAWDRFEKKQL